MLNRKALEGKEEEIAIMGEIPDIPTFKGKLDLFCLKSIDEIVEKGKQDRERLDKYYGNRQKI